MAQLSAKQETSALRANHLGRKIIPCARPWGQSRSRWHYHSARSELRRCLGLPGQAPSYKLGERIWLQAREDAKARAGAAFSLKDFHAKALSLGAMGLDLLRETLARV